MIIGINFTGIAEDVQALEDYRKALRLRKVIKKHWLKGITNNERDARLMIQVADNGRRSIILHPARKGFWALYIL